MTHCPSSLTGLPRGLHCSMKHGGSPSSASKVRSRGCYLWNCFPGTERQAIKSHWSLLAEKRRFKRSTQMPPSPHWSHPPFCSQDPRRLPRRDFEYDLDNLQIGKMRFREKYKLPRATQLVKHRIKNCIHSSSTQWASITAWNHARTYRTLISTFTFFKLKQNSHNLKLTFLRYTIPWHLVHSQCCITISSN
jgi:hypothetical protein